MKVGFASYPMLFQRTGGLQRQMLETQRALQQGGQDARFFRDLDHDIRDFDVIHVFAAINGNHAIVRACQDVARPVVISPVLHPPFRSRDRILCELTRSFLGRTVGWHIRTTFDDIRQSLDGASRVVALGKLECDLLRDGFAQDPAKISVIPNGVGDQFFQAQAAAFREHYHPDRPVVLCVGSIDRRKNQMTAAQVVRDTPADLYMVGMCSEHSRAYLDDVTAQAPGRVHYCGGLPADDPMLASAYKAADLMLLPSLSEVMPISVLEALAAGTPVVMTNNHCMDIQPVSGILEMFDPEDLKGMREACGRMIASPPAAEDVQALAHPLRWSTVAKSLVDLYRQIT